MVVVKDGEGGGVMVEVKGWGGGRWSNGDSEGMGGRWSDSEGMGVRWSDGGSEELSKRMGGGWSVGDSEGRGRSG